MKKLFIASFLLASVSMSLMAISPYLKVEAFSGNIQEPSTIIKSVLEQEGFEVIGSYSPEANNNLHVIVYTSSDLQKLCLQASDRGMLAGALKVSLQYVDETLQVSMLNPEYLFYAYFRDQMDDPSFKAEAIKISEKAKSAMGGIGTEMTPFGGDVPIEDLKKYKYMAGMPKFDDPIELGEFGSFDEAVATINGNLSKGTGSTVKVFEIIREREQIAVFGVGLHDQESGEAKFLPIIGEDHIAAMPYEIIVQGNEVTMLHGRFRFASHWPELTMKTFTKIMSSPGDVKDVMKLLVE